jgi:hypothetical protein
MTPEESAQAHQDPQTKQRIGEEVADVLLYLLQVADRSEIDLGQAVKNKLLRNAVKYPAKQVIERPPAAAASSTGTHVLLDFENVQPSEAELRAMVPQADQIWVFHGPHQRDVGKRFSSFGRGVTAVPISKTGKNALDFHLSFYTGYIASRHSASPIVVMANDKGYEPMIEHAKALGFVVRRQGHERPTAGSAAPLKVSPSQPGAKASTVKKAPAKKLALPAKKGVAKKANSPAPTPMATSTASAQKLMKKPPVKGATAKKAVVAVRGAVPKKQPAPSPTKSVPVKAASAGGLVPAAKVQQPVGTASTTADATVVAQAKLQKIVDSLQNMGDKRPAKAASLRRTLKSLLAVEAGHPLIEEALKRLSAAGVVSLGAAGGVSYPGIAST